MFFFPKNFLQNDYLIYRPLQYGNGFYLRTQ